MNGKINIYCSFRQISRLLALILMPQILGWWGEGATESSPCLCGGTDLKLDSSSCCWGLVGAAGGAGSCATGSAAGSAADRCVKNVGGTPSALTWRVMSSRRFDVRPSGVGMPSAVMAASASYSRIQFNGAPDGSRGNSRARETSAARRRISGSVRSILSSRRRTWRPKSSRRVVAINLCAGGPGAQTRNLLIGRGASQGDKQTRSCRRLTVSSSFSKALNHLVLKGLQCCTGRVLPVLYLKLLSGRDVDAD